MLDADAFTPTLVLEPRFTLLVVPRLWLKFAVPVPEKFTTPADGVTILNIWRGSALAVPAIKGAAAKTAASKRGRFIELSSKWTLPKAGLSQGWTDESRKTGVELLTAFSALPLNIKVVSSIVSPNRLRCDWFAGFYGSP